MFQKRRVSSTHYCPRSSIMGYCLAVETNHSWVYMRLFTYLLGSELTWSMMYNKLTVYHWQCLLLNWKKEVDLIPKCRIFITYLPRQIASKNAAMKIKFFREIHIWLWIGYSFSQVWRNSSLHKGSVLCSLLLFITFNFNCYLHFINHFSAINEINRPDRIDDYFKLREKKSLVLPVNITCNFRINRSI